MTREEAIEHGKEQLNIFGGEHREFIEMAIKALEQEPCEDAPFTIAELKDEDTQKLFREFKNQQVIVTDNDCSPSVTIIEPCEDAISREELLKAIDTWDKFGCDADTKLVPYKDHYIPYIHYDDVVKCIKTMPSVKPQELKTGHWTPCNERLPKENEYVGDVCKYYLIQDEYGDMHVAHLSNVGWIPMDSLKAIGNEIVAWQELPQPYVPEINVGKMEESEEV